nr:dentin sialophosphoprotein-like [Onthophagus taurus]
MRRRTPVKELLDEEHVVESPVRRSTRIAATSTPTVGVSTGGKITTRRNSNSSDSSSQSLSRKTLLQENKEVHTPSRSTRSASKSPTTLLMENSHKSTPVVTTRTRRVSRSGMDEENNPPSTSTEPTTRRVTRRSSITSDKPPQLDKIEEASEPPKPQRRTTRKRSSSIEPTLEKVVEEKGEGKPTNMETISETATEEQEIKTTKEVNKDEVIGKMQSLSPVVIMERIKDKVVDVVIEEGDVIVEENSIEFLGVQITENNDNENVADETDIEVSNLNLELKIDNNEETKEKLDNSGSSDKENINVKETFNISTSEFSANKSNSSPSLTKRKSEGGTKSDNNDGIRKRFKSISPSFDSESNDENKAKSVVNTPDTVKDNISKEMNNSPKRTPTKNVETETSKDINKSPLKKSTVDIETKTPKDIDKSPMTRNKKSTEINNKSPFITPNEKSISDTKESEKMDKSQDERDLKKSFKSEILTSPVIIDLITPMKPPLKCDEDKTPNKSSKKLGDMSTICVDDIETPETDKSSKNNKSLADSIQEVETEVIDVQKDLDVSKEVIESKKLELQKKAFNDAVNTSNEEILTENIADSKSKIIEEKSQSLDDQSKEDEVEKNNEKGSENTDSPDLFVSENGKSIDETMEVAKNVSKHNVFSSQSEKSDNETTKINVTISQDDVFVSQSEISDNEASKTDGNVSQDDVFVSEVEISDNETTKAGGKSDDETQKIERNVSQDDVVVSKCDFKSPKIDKNVSQDTKNDISTKDDVLTSKSFGETSKNDDSEQSKDEGKPSNKSITSLKSSSQESLLSSEIDESELAEISQFMKDFSHGLNKPRRSSLKSIQENISTKSGDGKIVRENKNKLESIVEGNAATDIEATKDDIKKRRSSLKPDKGNKSIQENRNSEIKRKSMENRKSISDDKESTLKSTNEDINSRKSRENKKSVSDDNESDEESDDTEDINVEILDDDVETNDKDIAEKNKDVETDDDENSEEDDDEDDTQNDEEELNKNEFIDDMAEEVDDEEIDAFDNSNDIPDDGESINTISTERDTDEESDCYGNDSFIDDGEENNELLSGNEEYFKDDNLKIKEKRQRGDVDKKYSRIVKNDDSSSEEVEPELIPVEKQTVDKPAEDDKDKEILTICVDDSESENEPAATVTEDTNNFNASMNTSRRNSLRKSSITIQENISLQEAEHGNLSERISKVVEMFCTGIKSSNEITGNISLNVSLGYEEDPNDEVFVTNKRKSTEPANVDKGMSPEKIRKVTETDDDEVNVEPISLSPSKSNPTQDDFEEHVGSSTKITPSKKNLDVKEDEFNIDILCPKKNNKSPSPTKQKKLRNKTKKNKENDNNQEITKEELKPKKEKKLKQINKNETESQTISMNENKQKVKKDSENKQKTPIQTRSKAILNKNDNNEKPIQKRQREIKKPIEDEPKQKQQKIESCDGWSVRPDKIVPSLSEIPRKFQDILSKSDNKNKTKSKKLQFPYTNVKDESWEAKPSSHNELLPNRNFKTATRSKRVVPSISTDSWEMKSISPRERVSNKMDIVKKKGNQNAGSSKVPSFHPKDFKNQMLHCMGRVDRMDSKILLRSKRAV